MNAPVRLVFAAAAAATAAVGLANSTARPNSTPSSELETFCGGSGAVGKLNRVIHPVVSLNGTPVYSNPDLSAHDTISTDQNGQVQFCVKTKPTICRTRSASSLEVDPTPKIAIRFQTGRSWCGTRGKGTVLYEAGAKIRAKDPIFAVYTGKKRTLVKVFYKGPVRVIGPSGEKRARSVKHGYQDVVPAGKDPLPPTPIEQSAEDKQEFAALLAALR